ncbi:MAG: divalent metal cation transporter [Thermoguttaceae bacterium]|nr:divalent metal cation transporter [Thermoguttaceae bacterium]
MSQDESKGLPMTAKWDPAKLQAEIDSLNELDHSPFFKKVGGYIKRSGPGLLQSAMTLGAGSAAASVVAGASFGYKLLWVQPLAMFLGVCMLAALSKVVLTKQEKPYKAFSKELGFFGPLLVFLWALGTISASVIWHFPQYGLAAGAVKDLAMAATGATELSVNAAKILAICTGVVILLINIITVWSYGGSRTGIKIYENFLRLIIFLVILSFGAVVVCNFGRIDWTAMGRGFLGLDAGPLLHDGNNLILVLGMLGAAVGINMTFLYPYSLLAKGWGPHHRTLAKWDLGMSMFIPFVLVTSLIMVGMTVGGVYAGDTLRDGLKPLEASKVLVDLIGPAGRVIFDLGLIGMTCGAISAHMVVCGFTLPEMCGIKYTKWSFRICALLPVIGVAGVMIQLPFWFPVFASAICFTMLPVAYLIFLIMSNKKSYLGDDVGRGPLHALFNLILVVALVVSIIGAVIAIKTKVVAPIMKNMAKPAVTAPAEPAPVEEAAPTEAAPAEPAPAE